MDKWSSKQLYLRHHSQVETLKCVPVLMFGVHSITRLLPILCMLCADMLVTINLQDGTTALFVASQEGHCSIVERLIEAGASLDLQRNVSYSNTVYK